MAADSTLPPAVHFSPGTMLQQYEIIRPIGKGGMGEVYLARDTRLGRLVAIKFLLEHSGPAATRFLAEARTTAQCRHDNIVVIYDVGEFQNFPYMVLEYIQGQSLRGVMAERGKGIHAMAVDIMLPVVRALECAHAMGIVHRDLKPENILFSISGQIKVLDFGIAKQTSLAYSATASDVESSGTDSMRVFRGEHRGTDVSVIVTNAMASEPSRSVHAGSPSGFDATMAAVDDVSALFATAAAPVAQPGPHSAVAGTMPYMSPEQWAGQGIDARTDIWAAGIILFELVTGKHPLEPFSMDAIHAVRQLDIPMPSAKDAGPLADVIDRCLKKRKEERFASATELALALERVGSRKRVASVRVADESPFAGLAAFQKSDAERFFGRDQDIAAALGKLRSQQLVMIAGPSGAGKSSFVRAGIIPALELDGRDVETFVLRPGRRPFAALADILAAFHDTSESVEEADAEAIAATLRTQPGHLGAKLRARCRKRGVDHRIVLLVDQFEELFTQGIDPTERAAFCACIEGVADDASSPLRVIATIRADFLDRVAEDRRFWGEVSRGLVFLPPMTRDGLRDALKKPLESAQYRFEDDQLVEEMLEGLEGTTTPLPILQFTATKLWEARDREKRLLTRSAYEALGGVAGALSTHADAVLSSLSVAEQRLARAILMTLVTPERTRAIVPFNELLTLGPDGAAVEQVINHLADARLLSMDASGEQDGKTVELSHESLIQRWSKLRQWLDENEHDAQYLAQIRNAAQQWEKNGEAEGFLWRDRAADEAGQWLERRKKDQGGKGTTGLGKREERYLAAVVGLAQRTRRWRRRIIVTLFLSISAIAVVVSFLAVEAREQARRADAEKAEAQAQRTEAQAQKTEAERSASRARNAMRVAAARERQEDPTTALALLREIEPESVPQGWSELAGWARTAGNAIVVIHHEKFPRVAQFSPDGRRIVTSSVDKMVWIDNADGSGGRRVLQGHTDGVLAAAWSPDGLRVVSGSRDKTVRIWKVDSPDQPIVLQGHTDVIDSVAFSPDGRWVASASFDKTVRVWNADGSGQPRVFEGHEALVRSVAFSPDGKRIASASEDKTVRVWDVDEVRAPVVFTGHTSGVYQAVFSPNGKFLATMGDDKSLRIWNADRNDKPIWVREYDKWVYSGGWSPDSKLIAVSNDNAVFVLNIDDVTQSPVIGKHAGEIGSVAFSPDGRHILTASRDGTVRVWPAEGPRNLLVLRGHSDFVFSVAFSPDGKHLASASVDKTIRVWNAHGRGDPLILRGHEQPVNAVAYRPDGKQLVSASADNTVRIWNADGSGDPLVLRGHTAGVFFVQYSPDSKRIVSVSNDRTGRVWNSDGQGTPLVLGGHEHVVVGASYSPDGTRIATASEDKTVRIWNADSGAEILVLRGHEAGVTSVAFSPDGKRIATASQDETVRIWNADGKGTPMILRGHKQGVWMVAWNPSGTHVASASQDKTVRVWNADGAGEPLVFRGAAHSYNSVSWSPDGKNLAAASDDKTVTVWSDIEAVRDAKDPRLWSVSTYCMPIQIRQQLLDFHEAQARSDLERCIAHVRRTHP